jgi:hypothetical protein
LDSSFCSDHPGEMKKCVAFSAVTGSREAWLPCAELAEKDYALCVRHSDMVAGVMLGVCVSGLVEDAISKTLAGGKPEKRRKRRKRPRGRRVNGGGVYVAARKRRRRDVGRTRR